jgi:parvulin-like peptidyl-prolyl isomerase
MRAIAWICLAFVAGIVAGEAIYRSETCREAIGRLCGRGRLLTVTNGHGIYEIDAKRQEAADQYLAGSQNTGASRDSVLERLVADKNLREISLAQISPAGLRADLDALRYQFADEKLWRRRQDEAGLSLRELAHFLRDNIAGRRWIEHSLTDQPRPDEPTLRNYYTQHLQQFAQPLRFRASHIFLAAPPETPADKVEAKKQLIESLANRLRDGEPFEQLVYEASEDEASKARAGDLGYFSEWRMPGDFVAAIAELKIGEPKTIRSNLGFHLVRMTEIKPARELTFEEARPEIVLLFTNARRREAVDTLAARLSRSSPLRARWFWN